MARPRKDAAGPSAEQRIHQAFWELIAEMPLERITVGDLAARAGCNRGTFYYYYDDIYALLDAVIDANLPKELPSFLFSHFTGASASPASDRELSLALRTYQPKVDHLCLLLANGSSYMVNRRVKGAIMGLWAKVLTGERGELEGDARIVLEFVVSGILGLMAYRAETDMRVTVDEIVRALAPELPDALAPKLRKLLAVDGVPDRFLPLKNEH